MEQQQQNAEVPRIAEQSEGAGEGGYSHTAAVLQQQAKPQVEHPLLEKVIAEGQRKLDARYSKYGTTGASPERSSARRLRISGTALAQPTPSS
jgi:hypothetical protein